MKKLTLLLLSLTLLLSACGKSEIENETLSPAESASPQSTVAPSEKPAEETEDKKEEIKEDKKEEVTTPSATPSQTEAPTVSVEDTMNKILSGVEVPRYELMPITSENFSHFMFTDYVEGAKGFSADALISSTAHSVCLVSLPSSVNAQNFASQVKQNADPRKWICVEAEKVEAVAKGNMVLLVMSDAVTTDKIVNNFKNNLNLLVIEMR